MTIKPCIKCGASERNARGSCKPCKSVNKAAYYAANPEKVRAENAAWQKANPEKVRAGKAAYYAANTEKVRATNAAWRVANTEKVRAIQAAYYAANSEKLRSNSSAYYAANVDKISAASAAYRANNKCKIIARQAAYRIANHDKVQSAITAWCAANPEKARIYKQNRRARKRANGGELSPGLAAKLFKLQRGTCPCCNQPLGDNYHMDHIMPIAMGGANEDWNIQLLRQKCNNQKCAKHPIDFMQSRGFLI